MFHTQQSRTWSELGWSLVSNSILPQRKNFVKPVPKAKSATQLYPQESSTRATKYGECVHWDLWGPAAVKSLNGKSYVAAVWKDDGTHEVKIYFLTKKSETFDTSLKDKAWILNHGGSSIQYMWCDHGGEFTSKKFDEHLDRKGTQWELTMHDLPPQNGVSEHGMCT